MTGSAEGGGWLLGAATETLWPALPVAARVAKPKAIRASLNIPAPTGGLLRRPRSVQASAVCALVGG